jgi:hypothetical protein
MFIITTGLTLLVYSTSAPAIRDIVDVETPYALLKKEIATIKSDPLAQQLHNDSLSALVTDALVNKIIPHWLGTPWSFVRVPPKLQRRSKDTHLSPGKEKSPAGSLCLLH